MKKFVWWGSAVFSACLLSVVLFGLVMFLVLRASTVSNGDWASNPLAGDSQANLYQKALVSVVGLLASTRKDSVYYVTSSASGKPLSLDCDYRVEGVDFDVDWWSITAYGRDYFLLPNKDDRYSFNNENVQRREDGSFSISVSSERKTENWLPVTASEKGLFPSASDFDLALRLYAPGKIYLDSPESAPLPKIIEEGCR
jgi:hypothetical protein